MIKEPICHDHCGPITYRNLIRPSLNSPQTRLLGVLTITFSDAAVIALKVHLLINNLHSTTIETINNTLEQATKGKKGGRGVTGENCIAQWQSIGMMHSKPKAHGFDSSSSTFLSNP